MENNLSLIKYKNIKKRAVIEFVSYRIFEQLHSRKYENFRAKRVDS